MVMRIPTAPRLQWLSLRFSEKNFERRFERISMAKALPMIRLSLISGAAIYGLFGILDAYLMGPVLLESLVIRFGIVIPVLVGIALFTFNPKFLPLSQILLAFAFFVAGSGIIAMTAIGPAPASYWYYAGLIIVVTFSCTAIRLHYAYSLSVSLFLFAIYEICAIYLAEIPIDVLMNNTFFLLFSVAFGGMTNYVQEYMLRTDYVKSRLLELESKRSARLRKKADAANHAKTEFLANMSHELRTPMNAIMGFSEVLVNEMFGPVGTPRYIEYAKDIHLSASHLLSIINDILDLAKAEAGKLVVDESEFDLCDLMGETMRIMRSQAGSKGLRFSLSTPRSPVIIRADRRLIRQAIINIIANAIKFTESGGTVDVMIDYDQRDHNCLITVADTGIGMSRAEVARCVEPFAQIQSAYTRDQPGAGLGLPMVAKIMSIHGGNFRLHSELGQGTTATAVLPGDRVTSPEPGAVNDLPDAGKATGS